MTLPIHPVAELFPLMVGQPFEDFCTDIDIRGVQDPVWTWTDPNIGHKAVVDGRNRCRGLAVANRRRAERGEPPWPLPTREWDGQGSLVAFVMSLNLHRRHLDESQRAMLAARAAAMMEEEARQRQKAGLKRGAESPSGPIGHNGKKPEKTRETAAKLANVSPRSVQRAKTILATGTKQLQEAVDTGKVTVSRAAEFAKLAPEEQLARIQREGAKASASVRKHDRKDAFDRWGQVVEKLRRQFEGHESSLPKLVRWAQKGIDLLGEEFARLSEAK